jgi:hypothetical protein
MAMHPYFVSQLAAEHVNDMKAQATAARRVREARRARRGQSAPAMAEAASQPCRPVLVGSNAG